MLFVNRPHPIPANSYADLIFRIQEIYSQNKNVRSVYQLGSINEIGISDLDVLVIYKSDHQLEQINHSGLSRNAGYILTHPIFALPDNLISDFTKYSLLGNYKLLCGESLLAKGNIHNSVARQIALEYLVKFFISLCVQYSSRIIKLRAFLLEVKAVKIDLDILGYSSSSLYHKINNAISYRKAWYKDTPSDNILQSSIADLFTDLHLNLFEILKYNKLCVPKKGCIKLARNISILDGSFDFLRKGPRIPKYLPNSDFALSYISKLFNRISDFTFSLPMEEVDQNSELSKKFDYEKKYIHEIMLTARGYIPFKSPLRIV